MKIVLKIAIAFITTFGLYLLLSLFVSHRSDINSLGGWYYGIISLLSSMNSLFVFLLLKLNIGKILQNGSWKIIVVVIWLYLLKYIIEKIIYFIPKETTSDSFFYDVPATLIYPYAITVIILWIVNITIRRLTAEQGH